MDPHPILWETTYPPYLQTIFFLFFKILSLQIFNIFVFINIGPYERHRCQRYSSHKSLLNCLKLLLIFCLKYHHKVSFSIFSSAWLCQQSSWNRNMSVVCRPSSVRRPTVRVAIISEPSAWISCKFWLLLPLSHTLAPFWNFWKQFVTNIFRFL